jgi:hypothetical protein
VRVYVCACFVASCTFSTRAWFVHSVCLAKGQTCSSRVAESAPIAHPRPTHPSALLRMRTGFRTRVLAGIVSNVFFKNLKERVINLMPTHETNTLTYCWLVETLNKVACQVVVTTTNQMLDLFQFLGLDLLGKRPTVTGRIYLQLPCPNKAAAG